MHIYTVYMYVCIAFHSSLQEIRNRVQVSKRLSELLSEIFMKSTRAML